MWYYLLCCARRFLHLNLKNPGVGILNLVNLGRRGKESLRVL